MCGLQDTKRTMGEEIQDLKSEVRFLKSKLADDEARYGGGEERGRAGGMRQRVCARAFPGEQAGEIRNERRKVTCFSGTVSVLMSTTDRGGQGHGQRKVYLARRLGMRRISARARAQGFLKHTQSRINPRL